MSSILAKGSVADFFTEAVDSAIKARGVAATNGATTYLVALLSDFAKPDNRADETLDRPLAFLLDEALRSAEPAERFDRLRVLGDGVLYTTGFFADHFEARGVDQKYLVGIGTTAYGAASSMLFAGNQVKAIDVYGELAEKFATFVEVIAEVADTTIARGVASSKGLVKLYERWLKTKSGALAQALSSHGLVPLAGTKGTVQ